MSAGLPAPRPRLCRVSTQPPSRRGAFSHGSSSSSPAVDATAPSGSELALVSPASLPPLPPRSISNLDLFMPTLEESPPEAAVALGVSISGHEGSIDEGSRRSSRVLRSVTEDTPSLRLLFRFGGIPIPERCADAPREITPPPVAFEGKEEEGSGRCCSAERRMAQVAGNGLGSTLGGWPSSLVQSDKAIIPLVSTSLRPPHMTALRVDARHAHITSRSPKDQ